MAEFDMREMGYSDKVFYYNGSGETATYNFRMRVYLNESVNVSMLRQAAASAIKKFPEYAVRPVIKDNKLYYEENFSEVAVFPDDGTPHILGADETNGHLWCILYGEKDIVISYYHGLSDFVGNWSLICTVIYEYGRLMGCDVTPEFPVRVNSDDYDSMDELDRTDPYTKYGDISAVPSFVYKSRGALKITEEKLPPECKELKCYELELSLQQFIDKTHQMEVSFIPLMTAVISGALADLYPDDDRPIVAKIPVNLRPLYGTKTTVNFSDSLILECTRDEINEDFEGLCRALKQSMKLQTKRKNFSLTIHRKRDGIIACEKSGKSIKEIADEITKQTDSLNRPVTYGLTYPGILDLPHSLQSVSSGVNMEPYMPTGGVFVNLGSYGGVLRLRFTQKFKTDKVVKAVAHRFEQIGIATEYKDCGYIGSDYVLADKIKEIQTKA